MSTSTAAAAPVSAPVASRPLSDTPRSTPVRAAAAAAPSQQQSSAVKPRPRPVLVAESSPRTQPQQQKFSRGYSSMRPPSPYKPIVCNTGGSGSLHRDPHRRPPVGGPTQPMRTLSHLPAALQRPPSAGVRPRMACLGRMDTAPPPAGGNSSTTKGPPAAAAYHPEPSSRSHLSDELVVPSGRPSADPSGYDSGRSPSAPQVHNTARKRKAQSISVSAYSAAEEDFLEAAAPLKLDFDDAGATVDSTKFCRSS